MPTLISKSRLISFRSEESGAVTVDWVVLTAAVVALCLAVSAVVGGGTQALAGEIAGFVEGLATLF